MVISSQLTQDAGSPRLIDSFDQPRKSTIEQARNRRETSGKPCNNNLHPDSLFAIELPVGHDFLLNNFPALNTRATFVATKIS